MSLWSIKSYVVVDLYFSMQADYTKIIFRQEKQELLFLIQCFSNVERPTSKSLQKTTVEFDFLLTEFPIPSPPFFNF